MRVGPVSTWAGGVAIGIWRAVDVLGLWGTLLWKSVKSIVQLENCYQVINNVYRLIILTMVVEKYTR